MINYSDLLYYNLVRNTKKDKKNICIIYYQNGIIFNERNLAVELPFSFSDPELSANKHYYIFLDQEPLSRFSYKNNLSNLLNLLSSCRNAKITLVHSCANLSKTFFDDLSLNYEFNLKYYFYHGLVSSKYWFSDYEFYSESQITSLDERKYSFLMLNHLVSGKRIYRPILTSLLQEKTLSENLYTLGSISNQNAEKITEFFETLHGIKIHHREKNIKDDTFSSKLHLASANIPVEYFTSSFLNIVTETCFFESYNHLTEKIFKPIVCGNPFILVSTPGTLSYLQSYGFETFGDVIDESYDTIIDPILRLKFIANEIERFHSMSMSEKQKIYLHIKPRLLANRNHFYRQLPSIVLKELDSVFCD